MIASEVPRRLKADDEPSSVVIEQDRRRRIAAVAIAVERKGNFKVAYYGIAAGCSGTGGTDGLRGGTGWGRQGGGPLVLSSAPGGAWMGPGALNAYVSSTCIAMWPSPQCVA